MRGKGGGRIRVATWQCFFSPPTLIDCVLTCQHGGHKFPGYPPPRISVLPGRAILLRLITDRCVFGRLCGQTRARIRKWVARTAGRDKFTVMARGTNFTRRENSHARIYIPRRRLIHPSPCLAKVSNPDRASRILMKRAASTHSRRDCESRPDAVQTTRERARYGTFALQ